MDSIPKIEHVISVCDVSDLCQIRFIVTILLIVSLLQVSDKNRLGEFFAKAPADLNIGSINVVDLNLGDIRVFNVNVDIMMDQPPKQIPEVQQEKANIEAEAAAIRAKEKEE